MSISGIIDGKKIKVKPMRISFWKNEIYDRKKEFREQGSSLIESGEMYREIFATENALTETYRHFIGGPTEGSIKREDKGLYKLISFLIEEERNKVLDLIKNKTDVETYYQKMRDKYIKY